jgi:hypothetical protein
MNELNHSNGKGDKERSPGWRSRYDEITFPPAEGFARRGNRLVKTYTPGRVAVFKSLACGGRCDHPGIENCGCLTTKENHGWLCTLPKGHEGEHIACGGDHHRYFAWPRFTEQERTEGCAAISAHMIKKGIKL